MLVETKCDDEWERIHLAAFYNNSTILLEELNSGTDPDLSMSEFKTKGLSKDFFSKKLIVYWNNMTPLYLAAYRGNVSCVKILMERGADPKINVYNTYYKNNETALSVAYTFMNFRCIRLMRKKHKRGLLQDQ